METKHISIDFSSSVPLYKQIHDQIIIALKTGRIKPGDKLPPIIKLAEKLEVSVNTVAKSYRMLELRGYLEKRRGLGSFISTQNIM